MENRGLIFIPDISGFTRFINQTEIEHSRLIIQELLEVLINSNQIGLEISEIEGDAILFFKFGKPPSLTDLYQQVEKMFCDFHRQLLSYDYRKYCQCAACTTSIDLSLKVISHYGEFTGYNVKNFNKLIGRDIIIAHQLLKNDIEQHEYWLVTDGLVMNKDLTGFKEWMKWDMSSKTTDSGVIPFHFAQLDQLKNNLPPAEALQLEVVHKKKMISLSREYNADIITLFHATGDFTFRHQWREGVKRVEEVDHFLPRVGMRCKSILENGEEITYASSYMYSEDRIEFSETDEKKQNATYYTLERTGNLRTKLTIDYYIRKGLINQLSFSGGKKKKVEESLKKSMINLDELVKQIHLPGVPEPE